MAIRDVLFRDPCPNCSGSGRKAGHPCAKCFGTGTVDRPPEKRP